MNKPKTSIALIGFMGTGKSSVAGLLGKSLDLPVHSTDKIVEEAAGESIRSLFEKQGEACFREMETRALNGVLETSPVIIDCGGGVVLSPENLEALKRKTCLVYLESSAEEVFENVKNDTSRPILNVDDPQQTIRERLRQRERFYRQADIRVHSGCRPLGDVRDEILKALLERDLITRENIHD